jgi:hypothetical protein
LRHGWKPQNTQAVNRRLDYCLSDRVEFRRAG